MKYVCKNEALLSEKIFKFWNAMQHIMQKRATVSENKLIIR